MSIPSSAIVATISAVHEYLLISKGGIATPTTYDEAQSFNILGEYQVFSNTETAEIGKIAVDCTIGI